MERRAKGTRTVPLTTRNIPRGTTGYLERRNDMKRAIIWTCAFIVGLSAGCSSVTKDTINTVASRHDTALVSADAKIQKADQELSTIPNPPPQVAAARTDLTGARTDIKTAQTEATKLKDMATKQTDKVEKIENSFWSPRQKQLAVAVGVTLALLGLAIVLMRFGGLAGALASVPILGVVLAKVGLAGKKV